MNTALTGLGQSALVLAGHLIKASQPVTLAVFDDLYDDLMAQRTKVAESLVALDLTRGDLRELKQALVTRINQFNKAVRGNAPGGKYERSLPPLPDLDTNQTDFISAAVRVKQLWTAINADTALGIDLPMTLEGVFTLANFTTLMTGTPPTVPGVKESYEALAERQGQVKLDREYRNDLQDRIYTLLKAYRQVLPTKFPAGHALLDSLPVLTPPPGATPPAVVITAEWDAVEEKAKITVLGTVPEGVVELEVRGLPGTDYDGEDDSVLGSIPLEGPLVFLTATYHATPGQSGSYKVFTKSALGHEAGSNAESVTRPVV